MKQYLTLILAVAISAISFAEVELGKTTMDIYGHVMLDMGIQAGQSNPDWYDVMRPSQLPVYKDQYGADGNFYTSVRQTRLGFKTSTPVGGDAIKTIFEFELFGVGTDAGHAHDHGHSHAHAHHSYPHADHPLGPVSMSRDKR